MPTWYGRAGGDLIAKPTADDADLGLIASGTTLTAWDSFSGGAQIGDLIDTASNPITVVTVDANGRALFGRTAANAGAVYLEDANALRWRVDPDDLSTRVGTTSAAWNDITGKPATFPPDTHTHSQYDQPAASETVVGVSRFATAAEVTAGTAANVGLTPVRLADRMTNVIEKDGTTGLIDASVVPTATDATPDTIMKRDADGRSQVVAGIVDGQAVNKGQLDAAIATVTTGGFPVRRLTLPSVFTSTTDGAYTTAALSGIQITDAKSGDEYEIDYVMAVRGVAGATGGVKLRFESSAAAETNRLSNPSFETDTTGWHATDHLLIERVSTQFRTGAWSLKITVLNTLPVGTASQTVWTDYADMGSQTAWSVGGYARRSSSTARSVRFDAQFGSSTAINTQLTTGVVQSVNGSTISPTTTAWTQGKKENASPTDPATVAKVRMRFVILDPVAGDVFYIDDNQVEPGATLPAYGSTGGGSSVLDIFGYWTGPRLSDGARDAQGIRYPAVAGLEATFQGKGTTTDAVITGHFTVKVGGTGLANQAIKLQAGQAAANATATTIEAARMIAVKVAP